MTFYEEMKDVASEVLEEFEQGTVVLSRTTTAPNPAAPWEPGVPTTTTYTLNAVVRGAPFKYVDGTLIVASDLMVTAAVHDDVTPEVGDTIAIDGGTPKAVKKIEATPAAGTPVAYKIFVAG